MRIDTQVVRGWTTERAAQEVRTVLDGYEARQLGDYDKLILAGMTLATAGYWAADLWAVTWANEQPSLGRLEIASNLLWGLWDPRPRSGPSHLTLSAITTLMALFEELGPEDDDVKYAVLMALAEAAMAPDVRASREVSGPLVSLLRGVQAQPLADQTLNKVLQVRVRDALAV